MVLCACVTGLNAPAIARPGFTTFTLSGSYETFPDAIANGVITGWYENADLTPHDFVRATNGTITTFDPPGSAHTEPAAIDDQGEITGWHEDNSRVLHAFTRQKNGKTTEFQVPGESHTAGESIDNSPTDKGAITDYYGDASQGFLRSP